MEISYRTNNYLSSSIKMDADLTDWGKARAKAESASQSEQGDRVEISSEGRSRLMSRLNGEEPDNSGRIAYGGEIAPQAAPASDDDTAQRIRELQTQLKEAMRRLQQARQELSEAQAKATAEVKAMQNGENPVSGVVENQQSSQEQKAAQQKVVSAQAEVNTIQEQLQKCLHEQAQSAGQ